MAGRHRLCTLPLSQSSQWAPPNHPPPVGAIYMPSLCLAPSIFVSPRADTTFTLSLCPASACGHHVQAHSLPHSIAQVSPRWELSHASGSLVFISGAPVFMAATKSICFDSWPWRPGKLVILGPMVLEQSERQSLADYQPRALHRQQRNIPSNFL